jgi:hypothetical protein
VHHVLNPARKQLSADSSREREVAQRVRPRTFL